MTSWIMWDLHSDTDDNPLKTPAEFEFNLEFEYDPGEPIVSSTVSNYDDEISCPPSVRVINAECKNIKTAAARSRVPTAHELDMLEDWFLHLVRTDANLNQQIQACGLEQMCFESYGD